MPLLQILLVLVVVGVLLWLVNSFIPMQGTIKHYDEGSKTGSVVTDDRTEIAIDAQSLGDWFIRTLRLGQRVRFEVAEENGQQVARELRLVTFAGR